MIKFKRKLKNSFFVATSSIIALCLFYCVFLNFSNEAKAENSTDKQTPPVETFSVKSCDIFDSKAITGVVDSVRKTMARARINGTIISLKVTEGDFVKQGQVIALVVDPKIALEIESLDARIQSAEQQMRKAREDYERAKALNHKNVISKAKYEEIETNFKVLENNLKSLRANKESQLRYKEEGEVIASVDGKILTIPVTNGSVIMTGENIAEIAENDFVLKLYIPESYSPSINVNDEITVMDESNYESQKKVGIVEKIYPKLESGKIIADIKLDHLDSLYVGKLMTTYIKTKNYKAIVIPRKYLIKKHGLSYVILNNQGEIVVQTGKNLATGVEVLSGLHEDDILVMP